jgi:hypothetical protein
VKVEAPTLAEHMQDEVPDFNDPLPESVGGSPMPKSAEPLKASPPGRRRPQTRRA